MSSTRWDPFQDLASVQDEMNQVFGRARQAQGGRVWAPALDIAERPDAYVVTVEIPGVRPEDLDITLEQGLMTIQGERRFHGESTDQQWHRVERRYGAFRRSITLPSQVDADAIEASFENGMLEVVVPKAEETRSRRIMVSAKPPGPGTSDDDDVFELRPPGPNTSEDDNVLGEG
jgi:HSP20 family protein